VAYTKDLVTIAAGESDDTIDHGSGSTVVLLHSSLSSKRQWLSLIERMSGRHRCIALDLIGYGDAAMPDDMWAFWLADETHRIRRRLFALLRRDEYIHIVGHSYGGAVALRLAQELGTQVRSLTLFEPVSFHLLPAGHSAVTLVRHLASCIRDDVGKTRNEFSGSCEDLARRLLKPTKLFVDFWNGDQAFDRFDEAMQLKMSAKLPKVVLDFQALLGDPSKLASMQSFATPTRLIGGRLSPRCTQQLLYILEAVLPNAELHWVPSGHLAPVTDPTRVNPVIESFIANQELCPASY
jgi:pimeloyl-ACP methyl ester carboxylesterase